MVSRCRYQSSSEIGAYAKLTNTYCLIPYAADPSFVNHFENSISQSIKIIRSDIAGTAIVGRLTAGNRRGLILPQTAQPSEFNQIRRELPDDVELAIIEEKFSALGNVISCNDSMAIVHPELEQETIDVISDVLGVEVVPMILGNEALVGSYSVFNNHGGAVTSSCSEQQVEELSKLFKIPVNAATVNMGSNLVSAGLCVNDNNLVCGFQTSTHEVVNLSNIFRIDDSNDQEQNILDIDSSLVDLL